MEDDDGTSIASTQVFREESQQFVFASSQDAAGDTTTGEVQIDETQEFASSNLNETNVIDETQQFAASDDTQVDDGSAAGTQAFVFENESTLDETGFNATSQIDETQVFASADAPDSPVQSDYGDTTTTTGLDEETATELFTADPASPDINDDETATQLFSADPASPEASERFAADPASPVATELFTTDPASPDITEDVNLQQGLTVDETQPFDPLHTDSPPSPSVPAESHDDFDSNVAQSQLFDTEEDDETQIFSSRDRPSDFGDLPQQLDLENVEGLLPESESQLIESLERMERGEGEGDKQKVEKVGKLIANIFGDSDQEEGGDAEFEGFGADEVTANAEQADAGLLGSDEEGDRGGRRMPEDMEYDFDIMMAQKKDEKRRKRRKRQDVDFINDNDDLINGLIMKMRTAAEADKQANTVRQPALQKRKILPKVISQLRKHDLQSHLIDNGIITALTEWLRPLPDKSLPALEVRTEVLKILKTFPPLNSDILKTSNIGKAVMYLFKHPRETRDNKRVAQGLISDWARPIFQISTDYRSLTREERESRDFDHMPEAKKKRMDEAGAVAEEAGLRPGDKGWIGRARVPRPSTKDYVIRPRWSTDGDRKDIGQFPDRKSTLSSSEKKVRTTLQNFKDRTKQQKARQAMTVNVDSSVMSSNWLLTVLRETQLDQFYSALHDELQLTRVEHFHKDYLRDEDLHRAGLSAPAIRRLRDAIRRYKAKQERRKVLSKIVGKLPEEQERPLPPSQSYDGGSSFTCLISRESLNLYEEIGRGTFAVVRRGVWTKASGRKQEVAVKQLLSNDAERLDNGLGAAGEFIAEVNSMHSLQHNNLVRLFGLVLDAKAMMMVLELCAGGALLDRLRDTARPAPLITRLWSWSIQIARGMAYLEQHRFIHRDLAARNVLLVNEEEKMVKIGDFGLMRSLQNQDQHYVMSAQKKVPFAWCAPESLKKRQFSHPSDVWMFGVTLWEIFSYGDDPWIGFNGQEILARVLDGQRLSKPYCCPPALYDLMQACWSVQPDRRPTFALLKSSMADYGFTTVRVVQRHQCSATDEGLLDIRPGDDVIVVDGSADNYYWLGQSARTRGFGRFARKCTALVAESVTAEATAAAANTARRRRVDISRPVAGSFIHAGHGDALGGESWGDPSQIDQIYLRNPMPSGIEVDSESVYGAAVTAPEGAVSSSPRIADSSWTRFDDDLPLPPAALSTTFNDSGLGMTTYSAQGSVGSANMSRNTSYNSMYQQQSSAAPQQQSSAAAAANMSGNSMYQPQQQQSSSTTVPMLAPPPSTGRTNRYYSGVPPSIASNYSRSLTTVEQQQLQQHQQQQHQQQRKQQQQMNTAQLQQLYQQQQQYSVQPTTSGYAPSPVFSGAATLPSNTSALQPQSSIPRNSSYTPPPADPTPVTSPDPFVVSDDLKRLSQRPGYHALAAGMAPPPASVQLRPQVQQQPLAAASANNRAVSVPDVSNLSFLTPVPAGPAPPKPQRDPAVLSLFDPLSAPPPKDPKVDLVLSRAPNASHAQCAAELKRCNGDVDVAVHQLQALKLMDILDGYSREQCYEALAKAGFDINLAAAQLLG